MNRIISVKEAILLSKKLKSAGKTIVLTGGCFDVIHLGHIKFLEAAQKSGDVLFVFVESDQNVKKVKGNNRPIHNQNERAEVLASIRFIDYVIKMPLMETNDDYDKVTLKIKPSIIAVTKNGNVLEHARRQAEKTNSKVVEVIERIPEKSTTKIARIISDENKL
jgi:rfaE bifunctional protein nucleotidyltransferase chain/domain